MVDEGRSWCFTTSELTLHPGWLLPFVFFFGDNCTSFLCTVHCTNDFTYPPELCFIVLCLNMRNCMQLHVTSYANCFLCYCAYLKLIWVWSQPWLWSHCLDWALTQLSWSFQLSQEQQPEPPPPASALIQRKCALEVTQLRWRSCSRPLLGLPVSAARNQVFNGEAGAPNSCPRRVCRHALTGSKF